MLEFLDEFRIDSETVRRDRTMCEGIASAYSRASARSSQKGRFRDRLLSDELAFAATNFRRAAAHSLLLGEASTARRLFGAAASAYSELGLPYAVMMSVLADGGADVRSSWWTDSLHRQRQSRAHERQLVYVVMAYAGAEEGVRRVLDLERILVELRASYAVPVGILGLPIGIYLELAEGLREPDVELQDKIAIVLAAYDSAIRRASANGYLWKNVAMPFHPAEPDVISVLTLVHSRWPILPFVESFPLSRISRTILMSALRQSLGTEEEGSG